MVIEIWINDANISVNIIEICLVSETPLIWSRDSMIMGSQVVRSSNKCFGISSLIRNASCSNGWLHVAVQCMFAVIIVTSFILILYMMTSSQKNYEPETQRKIHCSPHHCMVSCDQVPNFGKYAEDIIAAVSQLRPSCPGVYLTLNRPMFHNETLPTHWLPRMRLPILELEINAGNLKHFTPNVFLSQYAADIRMLVLNRLAIETWATDSFVGLNNLKELYLRSCTIDNVDANVFRAVHGTLETITIIGGKKWNPVNITGTITLSHLTMVDFNNNIFNNLLERKSFLGLEKCKMLYLNSCNISYIGEGTFDNLRNIEELYLNDNNLINIPTTLFNNILALTEPRPRINLHNNNWHCDCFAKHIYKLVSSGAMLTDPVCKQPESYVGKTFDQMVSHCNYTNIPTERIVSTQPTPTHPSSISSIEYTNTGCYKGNIKLESKNYKIISPISDHECPAIKIRQEDLYNILVIKSRNPMPSSNNWIKFTSFLKTINYSIIETSATETNESGILWHQSTCPNEVYCVDIVPQTFRIVNMDTAADYVFCPIILNYGTIDYEKCVTYNTTTVVQTSIKNTFQLVFVILIGGTCLIMGALCVYALIRKHPTLLKGSKRIVFVKHKTVDALVLPPKVPIRNDLVNEVKQDLNNEHIFILPANSFDVGKFNRNISMRSSKSYAPSYISALQPTEFQLSDWRNKNHFTNELTSEFAPYSWICNADTHIYTELMDNEKTYESLK